MLDKLKVIKDAIMGLTSEQIAFISVIVTILLYLLGKYNELKLKKHELKKEKYMKFIDMLKDTYLKGGDILVDEKYKEKFFEFGSTMFIYGSKKMYKKYCFFREFSSDFVKKCKYYNKEVVLYLMADMLNQIRKEIGMYNFELPLNFKSISFFTNDIYFNPIINLKWWKNKITVILIKFELFLYKIEELVLIKILINILSLPFKLISVIFKCLFMIPLGRLLIKLGIDKKFNINKNY